MHSFSLYSNICYYVVQSFWISSISSFWDSVFLGWGSFDNIYLHVLISNSYRVVGGCLYNLKMPIRMHRYPSLLGFPSLEIISFLECAGCVPPDITYIPTKSHIYWNHFHFFSFSIARWCFRMFRTAQKYSRLFSDVCTYRNTSSKIIYDATF